MKQSTLVLFSMLITFSVVAQEVISSRGGSYSNTNGSIDFTIGEAVINTLTDGNTDLTQGFHQTNWNFEVACDLVLSGSATSATAGFANGSATAIITGGTAPFDVLWNDPFEQTAATALGLFPGTYTCVVTDFNNCTEIITITVPLDFQNTTRLRVQFCGGIYALSDVVSCDAAVGAQNYRWQLTPVGGSPLPEYTRGYANRNLRLSWVSGIQLGTTYEVRVKALIDGEWGEYGDMCTINTGTDIPFTQLAATHSPFNPATGMPYLFCNNLLANYTYAAEMYEWELAGPTFHEVTSPSYFIQLGSISSLQMNTIYNVRVRVRVDGQWGAYGVQLPVSIGLPSNTQIIASQCGTTRALNQAVAATNTCGASSYTFHFQHATEAERVVVRPGYTCPLWLVLDPLTPGQTYQVSAKVTQGGVDGDYSSICDITIAGPQAQETWNEFAVNKSQETGDYQIYPNPTSNLLNIITSTYENVTYTLYDVQGKLVLKDNLTQAQTLIHIQSLSAGIYTLSLYNQTQYLKTFKLVKTQ